jgi:exosortase/archaeosortase family protein
MSFWIAYVIADNKNTWQKKLYWCVAGIFFIWVINCCRVSLLLLALQNNWAVVTGVDQHAMFNIVAYSFVFLMIWLYSRKNETNIAPQFQRANFS